MIGYLGPTGSYSFLAGATFYVREDLIAYRNVARLFYALEHDEVDGIIVPYENMKTGTSFDILGRVRTGNYHIAREILLDLVLVLVAKGQDISAIREVYGTDVSIDECYDTIKAELKHHQKQFVPSNRAALQAIETTASDKAAIVSRLDPLGDNSILLTDIRDSKQNLHKFVFIEKPLKVSGLHNRTLIACSPTINRFGALYDILHECVIRGVNIIKILSLPTIAQDDDIVFYIELEGNLEDDAIVKSLAMIKYKSKFVSILGSYYAT